MIDDDYIIGYYFLRVRAIVMMVDLLRVHVFVLFLFFVVLVVAVVTTVNENQDKEKVVAKAWTQSFLVKVRQPTTGSRFPSIIWFFWDGPRNVVLDAAVRSFQSQSGWEVRGLNHDTIKDYLDVSTELPACYNDLDCVARKTDTIRLALLCKYGGVWTDASAFIGRPLDSWVPRETNTELVVFYLEGFGSGVGVSDEVIENWFIAAPKQGEIIIRWRNLFFSELEAADKVAKAESIPLGTALGKSKLMQETNTYQLAFKEYLYMHVCMMYLRQRDPVVMALMKTPAVRLYRAESDPFYQCIAPYGFDHKLSNLMSAQELKDYEAKRGEKTMFTKLTGGQRKFVVDNYDVLRLMSLWKRPALLELISRQ